ncbi:Calcineurin-like phosphoesterase [Caulifigura coniformis]|uniref:Calcineurin-like phosphoesterase n=1 Tax=Caulifigura coniformis TaxID=2527983 RepID=A0A517SDQ8_9PLAN|nr:metallophosphoesterase [Caulifigura coniformis]QDT54263.1 Calcineurin-like phosphoesterase [Caulifigura coniformis]
MERRDFLTSSLATGAAALLPSQVMSAEAVSSRAQDGRPLLTGSPVLSGPAADSLTILQPVSGPATGFVELSVNGEPFQRIDAESDGLLPYAAHVLKFRLPELPAGTDVKYRVSVTPVDFQTAYKIQRGEAVLSPTETFRTLDPAAKETRFAIWNDTHENQETIAGVHRLTVDFRPDFLLWNGDQTNDIYTPAKMSNQYLAPGGLAIAASWPLAYARGNHDVRGPAARHLPEFTGTPGDRFYYAFRSGPVAALVMDTGEDKVDEHPVFGGLAAFTAMRERQTRWLAKIIKEPFFRDAPYKLLFCHIPLFWIRESPKEGPWESADLCRDAWLPLLKEGGIQLIVSGHTHQHRWLPAGSERPIGQLIGGGPKPPAATFTEGIATSERLAITMRNLQGKVLHSVELKPAQG